MAIEKPYRILNRSWLTIVIILGFGFVAFGQNCNTNLDKAQRCYNEGKLYEIADLITPCLDVYDEKIQKETALKLLVLANLFTDDYVNAEKNLLKLLKSNPQFVVSSTDPPELDYFLRGFLTKPIFNYEFLVGVNRSEANLLHFNSVGHQFNSSHDYHSKLSYNLGGNFNYNINEKLQAGIGLHYINQKLNQTDSLATSGFVDENSLRGYDFTFLEIIENQSWLEVPVKIRYEFNLNNLQMYAYAGGTLAYLMDMRFNTIRHSYDPIDIETPQRLVRGPSLNLLNYNIRKQYHVNLLAGIGLKYPVGNNFIVFDLSMSRGFTNHRNEKAALNASSELLFQYGYIENDFSMNSYRFSVGFMKPIYKPQKRKLKNEL